MKRLAALSLMSLLMFNWYGYRLVSSILEMRADHQIQSAITLNHYNSNDLLRFTVPLNLPYQNIDPEFKDADGQIAVNGKVYNYVKRRISNDSMTVLCLPNHEKTRLSQARHNYFAKIADVAGHKDGKAKQSSAHFKFLAADAELTFFNWAHCASSLMASAVGDHKECLINKNICLLPSQPPETFLHS